MSRQRTMGFMLLALACASPAALGQNALGDGRALDRNLSTTGRFNRARPSLASEFAFRNSVVTGNAPGGMSFRGDIGYRAPGEFGGELGSNDLFAYRRDSLRSGMAGMGIRGTEALQYQLSLTTGNRPPANLVGRYTVSRSGTSPSAGDISRINDPGSLEGLRQRPAIDEDADDRGTMLWMLRSPSAYISNSSLQTSALRVVKTPDSEVYTLTASPLRGVRLSPVPGVAERQPQGGAETRPDGADEAETDPRQGSPGAGRTGGLPVRTLHSDILNRLAEQDRSAKAEDALHAGPSIADRVREILGQLGNAGRRDVDGTDDDENSEQSVATGEIRFDQETMRLLRGDGTPLNEYVDPDGVNRNVYAEHMNAGQELMAAGRYFDAEERFAHALAIRRSDVTAQVARLHAQIGAGLFLSATLNMQSLAFVRPEVFAVKYGESLLPSRDRLEKLIDLLAETIDGESDRSRGASPQVRQASGLLLAYIGFQLDREALVRSGLDDFRARVTAGLEPGQALPIEARLGEMFRAMWLRDDTPIPAPTPSGEGDG